MAAPLFLILVLAIILATFVWWLIMLIDALRTPSSQWTAAGQNQILYVVLMVFLGLIGTIAYVAVARPELRKVSPGPFG